MVSFMVHSEKIKRIAITVLYLYLIAFPFGQLLSYRTGSITLHLSDVLLGVFVLFGSVSLFLARANIPRTWVLLAGVLVFSQAISLKYYNLNEIAIGLLYLIRLFAYLWAGFIIYTLWSKDKSFSTLLLSQLLVVSFFIAVFGWVQYFMYPDLRSLFWLGWDDHYLRLVGTYLDPAFTSILLVLGFVLSLYGMTASQELNLNKKYLALLSGFLLFTLLFTYSRSGYLSLVSGILVLSVRWLSRRVLFSLLLLFAFSLFLLPRGNSEGVKLERIASIEGRVKSYIQGLEIIKEHPVFGVGFNNICLAKTNLGFEEKGLQSHSCSGLDNVFLTILSTTGMLGLFVFLYSVSKLFRVAFFARHGRVFVASLVAVLVHSQFNNSFFYPWVIGWMALIGGVTLQGQRNSK